MKNYRIPRTLGAFDTYLKAVVAFLLVLDPVTNLRKWELLGLVQAEMTALSNFLTSWFTGNPLNPGAYELHTNPETKGKKTRISVVGIMKNFFAFFQPLLVRISGSANLTDTDMLVLNIKKRKNITHYTQKITSTIHIVGIGLGTGLIRLKFYSGADSNKPSIPEGADRIQTAIVVVNTSCDDGELSGKVKKTAPKHPDDGTHQEVHSKANFTMQFNSIYAGKELHIFARYYLDRHPELAGPWCLVRIIRIPF